MAVMIKVCGSMGSGKTTLMRTLIRTYHIRSMYGVAGGKNPEAYWLAVPGIEDPVFILGPYTSQNGGLDRVYDQKLHVPLIEKYADRGHVLFEHLGESASYGRIGRALDGLQARGHTVIYAFMATDLATCVAGVAARRGVRGKEPKGLTGFHAKHFANVARARRTLPIKYGIDARDLRRESSVQTILTWLRESNR